METVEQKTERNSRVQARYDELMREGKRGHYETTFRVVREEVERERERCANVVRYWLAGYAPDTVASHEARCLAHVLDGRPAPEGPNSA